MEPSQDAAAGPRIGVFAMGGTIAMSAPSPSAPEPEPPSRPAPGPGPGPGPSREVRRAGSGVVPRLTGGDLVAAVPGLDRTGIATEVHDVRQLPSASLGMDDVVQLAGLVEGRLGAGAVDGAVVIQGTDTIEETGWLLDLLLTGDAPVVVTGAMRHSAMAGADGPANLLAAIRVAASPAARGLGVTVVFADDLHAARAVRKAHTTSVAAFASPSTGPIGHVREGSLSVWSRPARLGVAAAARARTAGRLGEAQVVLVPMTFDDDGMLLRAVAERVLTGAAGGVREDGTGSPGLDRVDGLVIAGFGVGHVPARVLDVLTDLAGRIPVVLATRCAAGPVLAGTYGYPGSETDLRERGLIGAGYLDAYKSRLLLRVLLDGGADREEIRRSFSLPW